MSNDEGTKTSDAIQDASKVQKAVDTVTETLRPLSKLHQKRVMRAVAILLGHEET